MVWKCNTTRGPQKYCGQPCNPPKPQANGFFSCLPLCPRPRECHPQMHFLSKTDLAGHSQLQLSRNSWIVRFDAQMISTSCSCRQIPTQSDLKSAVIMVEIVLIWDFIFMFLCLDMVLYSEGYFTFYMLHYLGWFVLYPRCRVNRDTNLSVVYDYVIF